MLILIRFEFFCLLKLQLLSHSAKIIRLFRALWFGRDVEEENQDTSQVQIIVITYTMALWWHYHILCGELELETCGVHDSVNIGGRKMMIK